MSADEGGGKEVAELAQQVEKLVALLRRSGVSRFAVSVKATLVADAYGAAVVWTAVGTNLKEMTMLSDGTVAADIEMVADGAETTRLVAFEQLLNGEVTVATGGRAVDDDEAHALGTVHEQSWLNTLGEATLGSDLVLTDDYWECFCDHDNGVIKASPPAPPQ